MASRREAMRKGRPVLHPGAATVDVVRQSGHGGGLSKPFRDPVNGPSVPHTRRPGSCLTVSWEEPRSGVRQEVRMDWMKQVGDVLDRYGDTTPNRPPETVD